MLAAEPAPLSVFDVILHPTFLLYMPISDRKEMVGGEVVKD